MNATTTSSTCWACAEELPRGATKCPSCGEQQPTCWACAEPRPRGATKCPSCGEPSQGPSGGSPSLVYLLVLPFLFAVLGHQLGLGPLLGSFLGLGGWTVAAVVGAGRASQS